MSSSSQTSESGLAHTHETENNDPRLRLLESPFNDERNLLFVGSIPNVTGITDLHLDLGRERTSGKAPEQTSWPLGSWLYGRYRETSILTMVGLRAARDTVKRSLSESSLLLNGGDIVDAMTLKGFATSARYFLQSNKNSMPTDNGNLDPVWSANFFGSLVLTGNHDTDFAGSDRRGRYEAIRRKYGDCNIDEYLEILNLCKDKSKLLNSTISLKEQKALHPGLRWYLERSLFGLSIGGFINPEKKEQAIFLNSEFANPNGSLESLVRSLVEDLDLKNTHPELFHEIINRYKQDLQIQEEVIEAMLKNLMDGYKTVAYGHDPHRLQNALIDRHSKYYPTNKKWSTELIQSHMVVWGGHWHTNDDGSAWKQRGVQWFNPAMLLR